MQIAVALAAGRLSREPFDARLGLGVRRLAGGALAVAAAGCVAVSSVPDAERRRDRRFERRERSIRWVLEAGLPRAAWGVAAIRETNPGRPR